MDLSLILQMIVFSLAGAILYTFLGVIPGTDETAVLAPVTLAIALSGVAPQVLVAFFISAIIAKMVTGNIPVAVAGIPSGVMSAPMIPSALKLKEEGLTTRAIHKMSAGSLIGTVVAIPLSFLLARLLAPFSDLIAANTMTVFMIGTLFLALMAKNKLISLVAIFPLSLLFQSLNYLYRGLGALEADESVFISFFLAITIGPMMVNLFELMIPGRTRSQHYRQDYSQISLGKSQTTTSINPFKLLTKEEGVNGLIGSVLGVVTFFMSPVGMMIFIGELLAKPTKDETEHASMIVTVMNALNNAAYIAGILIPLLALGVPLSPLSIGPGNALFNAPPVYTIDHNIHHLLTTSEFILPVLIGGLIGLSLTYYLTVRYARQLTAWIFSKVSHEALLGVFLALALLLAFRDAGWVNLGGMILVSLVSGWFNRWGVNYGVQFMILYASAGFVGLLI